MSIVFEKKIGGEKTATRPSGRQPIPNFVNYTFSVKYFCTKNLAYLMSFLYKMHKLSKMHKKDGLKAFLIMHIIHICKMHKNYLKNLCKFYFNIFCLLVIADNISFDNVLIMFNSFLSIF